MIASLMKSVCIDAVCRLHRDTVSQQLDRQLLICDYIALVWLLWVARLSKGRRFATGSMLHRYWIASLSQKAAVSIGPLLFPIYGIFAGLLLSITSSMLPSVTFNKCILFMIPTFNTKYFVSKHPVEAVSNSIWNPKWRHVTTSKSILYKVNSTQ